MGLTVRDVIEQCRSQHLSPGGVNQEEVGYQSGSLTSNATSMTLATEVAIPDGEIVEWDDGLEVALVKDQSTTTVNFAHRGYLETTAESHAAGTRVIVGPIYTKKILVDALTAVISSLRGYGLYARGYTAALTLSTSSPVSLPATAFDVAGDILYQNGTQWMPLVKGTGFRVFYNFAGVDSVPSIQFFSGLQGAAMKVIYKRDFILPQASFDADTSSPALTSILDVDLDDCLIPPSLQVGLPLGIAQHVLVGRDIPATDAEHIRRASQNAQVPVGTRTSLSRTLQSRWFESVTAEMVRLKEANPTTIVYERY